MDLTVARLKVLGEDDIAALDKKIKDYQASNNPSILTKDLETIQNDIKTLQQKYNIFNQEINTLTGKHKSALKQCEQHKEEYKKLEDNRIKLTTEIDTLFIQQEEHKSEIAKLELDISAKKIEIVKSTQKLDIEKRKLIDVNDAHKQQDSEYQEHLKDTKDSISKLEDEIKTHRQNAYKKYVAYDMAVKECSLNSILTRDPVTANFADIKNYLLRILAENMGNFAKMREYYGDISKQQTNICNTIKQISLVHNHICDNLEKSFVCSTEQENNLNYNFSTCPKCGYENPACAYILGPFNNPHNTFNMDRYCKTLHKLYKIICQKIITDVKLNAIIQNTTYDKLFEMIGTVFETKKYNVFEFLLFLAFLGTGGKAHNLFNKF